MTGENWTKALDTQTDLIGMNNSPVGQREWESYLQSLVALQVEDRQTGLRMKPDQQTQEDAKELVTYFQEALPTAEPVYVTPEVCRVVGFAAKSFEPEPIEQADLLTDSAFIYLAESLPIFGEDTTRALQYHSLITPEMWTVMQMLYVDAIDSEGDSFPWTYRGPRRCQITPYHQSSLNLSQQNEIAGDEGRAILHFFRAFCRLAQQRIFVNQRVTVERAARKRARSWRNIDEILVVMLRRVVSDQDSNGSGLVDWSHRWMVNGHWRWQPYKENGHVVRRQIWIAPYIKGPDGKPLVLKRRVFSFTR